MIKGTDNIHDAIEKIASHIEKTAKWGIPAAAVAGIGAGAGGHALFERHQRDKGRRSFGGYKWDKLEKYRKKGMEAKDPKAYFKSLPAGVRMAIEDQSRHYQDQEGGPRDWPWGSGTFGR